MYKSIPDNIAWADHIKGFLNENLQKPDSSWIPSSSSSPSLLVLKQDSVGIFEKGLDVPRNGILRLE
jgi:hypothetical protein